MKKIAFLPIWLTLVMAGLAQFVAGQPPNQGGVNKPLVFYVISADAPGYMHRGGQGRYLCDGTADNVQIQAAIDAAEAMGAPTGEDDGWYGPEIVLSPGTYDIAATIDVGYDASGDPNGNAGVTIKAEGRGAWLKWSGGTSAAAWIMRFAPGDAESGHHPTLENLIFHGDDKASGLHLGSRSYRRAMSDLTFYKCKGFTLYAATSWEGTFRNLYVTACDGAGSMAFMEPNGTKVEHLLMRLCENNSIPRHRRYMSVGTPQISGGDGAFIPFEYVTTAGGKVGMILRVDSTRPKETWVMMEFGTTGDVDFADTEEITGQTSTATATIDDNASETLDLGAGILFYGELTVGSCPRLSQAVIQGNAFVDDSDDDPDLPMIVIRDCGGAVVEQVYTEATAARSAKQANTYIYSRNNKGAIFRNLNFQPASSTIAVAGAALATDTITTTAAFTAFLLDNDYIYCWDGLGGIVDGEYRVDDATPSGTTFDIDTGHGAGNDAAFNISCWTATSDNAAERLMPAIGIDLYNSDYATIENCTMAKFRHSFVKIENTNQGVAIINLRDDAIELVANELALARSPSPVVNVDDSGSGTIIIGGTVVDPTALDYTGAPDSVKIFEQTDGITHKTTLVLHEKNMTIADAGAGDEGWGTEVLYTFPEGQILILGVVSNMRLDATDQYDVDTVIADNAAGDFAIGTAAISDETPFNAAGTDEDLVTGTATLLSGGIDATLTGAMAANAQYDGTVSAATVNANVLFDAGAVAAGTFVALKGTVTIHWVELGDY